MSAQSNKKIVVSAGARSAEKKAYVDNLNFLVDNHDQVIMVECDNVGSRQMSQIRLALRGKATILMGKNTMIRRALNEKLKDNDKLPELINLVKYNVGLVFCHAETAEVRKIIMENKVPAPAKVGAIAPSDVIIPAGGTGMDPGQTAFFQTLQIPTKIVKGQIEIQSDVHVIKEGDKVTASQSVLLSKLNICPFAYGLKPTIIYDAGVTYPASVLDIDPQDLVGRVTSAISQIACFSLAADVPSAASLPHSIAAAVRNIAGFSIQTDILFPETEALKAALEAGPVAAAPSAAAQASAPAAEAPKEEEEEDDEDMGLGLFD